MKPQAAGKRLLTVPGNILLLGEYAVLEEGGLGITAAIEKRLVIEIEPAGELIVLSVMGASTATWKRSEAASSKLVGVLVAAAERELGARGLEARAPELGLRVDSSAFFAPDGGKLGLGSSAAVAVGIEQALLRYSGLEDRDLAQSCFRAALAGHRSHQGGLGSGYDIAASLHGGLGLFTGGELPSFEALALPWMRPFSLLRGPRTVDSAQAIGRYLEWKGREPRTARVFLEESNEIVRGFARAGSWAEAALCLKAGAQLGLELGDTLGLPARVQGLGARLGKALGAGDELAALWGEGPEGPGHGLEAVEIAQTGPLWNE